MKYTIVKNPLLETPVQVEGWFLGGDVTAAVYKDEVTKAMHIEAIEYGDVHVYNAFGNSLDTPVILRGTLLKHYEAEVERIIFERAEKASDWADVED